MKHPESDGLFTPIHLNTSGQDGRPAGPDAYFLLARNGLFLCRNHPLFSSAVRAPSWPSELLPHEESLTLRLPPVSRSRVERIVGFFSRVYELYASEAAALLVLDGRAGRVRLVVPSQVATVNVGYGGRRSAVGVRYDSTPPASPESIVVGDVHSHADLPAYSSHVDQRDEEYRPGLHVVVGRVDREPPEFHCEFVVDGARFPLASEAVLAGYVSRRTNVPDAWLERVSIEERKISYSAFDPR